MDDFAITVEAGDGVVGRWGAAVVVSGGDRIVASDLMADLLDAVGPDPAAGDLIGLLRSDPRFNRSVVDLAAAVSIPDGLRVFLRGQMEARTESDDRLGGPEPIERDLPGVRALWLGSGRPPSDRAHSVLDLEAGVVPGRGVVVHRTPASPDTAAAGPVGEGEVPGSVAAGSAPAGPSEVDPTDPAADPPDGWPPPEPGFGSVQSPAPPEPPASDREQPIEVRPFVSIDFGQPAEARAPLPVAEPQVGDVDVRTSAEQVMGIRCSRDHFNNPKAGYCQVCGISMVHLTHRLEPGRRPTLGFVVFADGATYALDRSYLIGRDPTPASDRGLTPLTIQDPDQSVSREHAELRLDGWDVVYEDIGSTNGSFLWNPTSRTWSPLGPRSPMVLVSGTTVSVGRMSFVFEAASKEIEAR